MTITLKEISIFYEYTYTRRLKIQIFEKVIYDKKAILSCLTHNDENISLF